LLSSFDLAEADARDAGERLAGLLLRFVQPGADEPPDAPGRLLSERTTELPRDVGFATPGRAIADELTLLVLRLVQGLVGERDGRVGSLASGRT